MLYSNLLHAQEKLALGQSMPKWIHDSKTKKEKNNVFTNDIYSVQGDKSNHIVWYKRFIEVNGSLGVFKTWDKSKYSHATLVYSEGGNLSNTKNRTYPKRTVKCGKQEMLCQNFENLESWVRSLKSSANKLESVDVYYKEGNVTKMTYKYAPETTRKFILSVEYGHKL